MANTSLVSSMLRKSKYVILVSTRTSTRDAMVDEEINMTNLVSLFLAWFFERCIHWCYWTEVDWHVRIEIWNVCISVRQCGSTPMNKNKRLRKQNMNENKDGMYMFLWWSGVIFPCPVLVCWSCSSVKSGNPFMCLRCVPLICYISPLALLFFSPTHQQLLNLDLDLQMWLWCVGLLTSYFVFWTFCVSVCMRLSLRQRSVDVLIDSPADWRCPMTYPHSLTFQTG